MENFIYVLFGLCLLIPVIYTLSARAGTFLNPILNVIVMAYLVYCVVYHSTAAYIHRLPETPTEKEPVEQKPTQTLSNEQMKENFFDLINEMCVEEAKKGYALTSKILPLTAL